MAITHPDPKILNNFGNPQSPVEIPDNKKDFISIKKDLKSSEMKKFYNNIDVLLIPIADEGIGRMTLEAMSSGTPVIMLGNHDRNPIVHMTNGFLVSENFDNIDDIIDIVTNKPHVMKSIGAKSRRTIEDNYSNEVLMSKLRDIYDSLT